MIKTGHDQFTSGGSVSNHFEGRGIDIARVDGEIVNSGSTAARELATEIAALTGDLRPTEVGTPFSIGAPGFFTDGAHQDHLHVAFDGEPPAGFTPPAPAAPAAPVAAVAAAPVAGQPVAAAAAAEPAGNGKESLSLSAVTAEAASKRARQGRIPSLPGSGQAEGGRRGGGRAGGGTRRRGRSTSPASLTPIPATTPRASRSRPGWPSRPRRAGCRPSCR